MKFIREIISGKQGSAGQSTPVADQDSPGGTDGMALDLEKFSVQDEPVSDPAPIGDARENEGNDDFETYRMAADPSLLSENETSSLSADIASFIMAPSAKPADDLNAPKDVDAGQITDQNLGQNLGQDGTDLGAQDSPRGLDDIAAAAHISVDEPQVEIRRAPRISRPPEPSKEVSTQARDALAKRPASDALARETEADVARAIRLSEAPKAADGDPEKPGAEPVAASGHDPVDRDASRDDRFDYVDPSADADRHSSLEMARKMKAAGARANRPATKLSDAMSKPVSEAIKVPAPAAGRAARRAGRVKTRLLGFGNAEGGEANPFDSAAENQKPAQALCPVGWMVLVGGPGRGNSFTLYNGVAQIGRGEDQAVRLDFGDTSISRSNHAAVAYDNQNKQFYLGHGGKTNLVRLNGKPVLSTEELESGALIQIGETTLQFVALCGSDFDWDMNQDDDIDDAAFG